MVTLIFNLWGTARLFCKVAASFYVPISTVWAFQFLYILFSTSYYLSSWLKPCYGYDMLSHCGFDLHLPDGWLHWTSFHVLLDHFYIFLEKCLFRSFVWFLSGLFVFLLLSCKSSLCIRDTRPLSDIWLASIFSHSVGCLSLPYLVF